MTTKRAQEQGQQENVNNGKGAGHTQCGLESNQQIPSKHSIWEDGVDI